jgi:ribosome-binding ATPase
MLIGIVGKPSSGKSTFFKSSTLAEIEIGSRPFVTIKPNHGTGYVKVECVDKDFNTKCNPRFGFCIGSVRFVPVDLLDVAGLVPGAHEGKGLGSQFLDDLNEADALIHVIDISGSTDAEGNAVEPLSYDPKNDIEFLETELDQWYLRILKKGWDKFSRTLKQDNQDIKKALAKQLSGLRVTELLVQDAIKELNLLHQPTEWSEEDLLKLSTYLRKATKPMIIAANKVDVPGAKLNFEKVKEAFPDYKIIPCSSESELALREAAKHELLEYIPGDNNFKILKEDKLNEKQLEALNFIKESVLKNFNSTGVQDVLDHIVFNILKYIAIFPGGVNKLEDKDGNVLPDCFLLPENSTALDFAYKIHKDLGDKFIKAIDVKKKLPIGKEHQLNNRDVVEIVADK